MESQTGTYRIERILNNNVVILQRDEDQDEQIVVGKGIGFGAKRGQEIPMGDTRIEKRFRLVHEENQAHFQQLFSVVPNEVIGTAEEIILLATRELGLELHEHIHVAFADHIGFALSRLKGGITIENPFLEEIRTLYPEAWDIAQKGAEIIEQRFHIPIPPAEVGFLTLHIHSASHHQRVSDTLRITDAVNLAIRELEAQLGATIPRTQLNYPRLVIHIRFAIQRVLRGEPIQNPLADTIQERMLKSYTIAKKVAEVMEKRLNVTFPDDEIAYLTMHVERFVHLADKP